MRIADALGRSLGSTWEGWSPTCTALHGGDGGVLLEVDLLPGW